MKTKHFIKKQIILTCSMIVIVFLVGQICFAISNKLVKEESTSTKTVEVTSGNFIEYHRHLILWDLKHQSWAAVHALPVQEAKFYQRNTTYLSIPWNGQELFWIGVGVPISLRSYEGNLYMITFDRESDFHKIRFRYYKQEHNVLSEISCKDYPKSIATQNLWLDKRGLELVRELNPENSWFRDSLTANIWYQLEKEKEYYQQKGITISAEFLKEYIKKNKVQKLETLVKDK